LSIHVIDVESMQKFSADEVQPIVLQQSDGLVTLLVCLEADQEVGPCVMTTRVLYLVLAGRGQLCVVGEQAELNAGSLVVVPADVVRSIVASEQMRLLAVQIP
jgi:quercetin dioxygenase-like cupin family protein